MPAGERPLEFMMTQHAPKHPQVKLSYALKAHIWQIQRWAWAMRQMVEDVRTDVCSRLIVVPALKLRFTCY